MTAPLDEKAFKAAELAFTGDARLGLYPEQSAALANAIRAYLAASHVNEPEKTEHVGGDALSSSPSEMEATRWSAIGAGQMAADPEGRWVSVRDFDQAQSALAAMRAERDEARKLAGLGCDANHGGTHSLTKQGTYTFCTLCGETIITPDLLERARSAEAQVLLLTEENEALRKERDHWAAHYERVLHADATKDDRLANVAPFLRRNGKGCMTPEGPAIKTLLMLSDLAAIEDAASVLATRQERLQIAGARIKALEEAIDEIASFDVDGPLSPETVQLIRIAGAARRSALKENAL